MRYFLIALGIAIVVALVAIPLCRLVWENRDGVEPGGFRDWVKNPDYKRFASAALAAPQQERESLTVPDDISDAELQKMVDRLFEREDRHELNYERLKLVGRKAYPLLVAALDDPRIAERFRPTELFSIGRKVPLQRVTGLLQVLDEPLAVRTLKKYVEHPDDEVRKSAADSLGEIGAPECIEPIVRLLDDENDYVRSYAMIGIDKSIKANRATREFLTGIFPALVKLLDRPNKSVDGRAPQLLLLIDRDRAIPILLSPEYFTVKNRQLHYILEALNQDGFKVPHNQLLPLLDELKSLSDEYPYSYAYAMALGAYARNPDNSTAQRLRSELESAEDRVQEAAAEGLARLSGIGPPIETVFKAVRERGFDSLTEPQKRFYAALIYHGEVNNGGHEQYFVNSSGDVWPLALAGLKAIGATERANILQEAIDQFGPKGPSHETEERHRQLSKFTARQDRSLEELNDRYYGSKENVDALLSLYAIENAEAFRQ